VNPLPCLCRSGFAQAGTRGEENILLFSNENDLVKSLKTVTPAPFFNGINSSRGPELFEFTGFPLEFTPYLDTGRE